MPNAFIAATRIASSIGTTFTGNADNVLDDNPSTYCDLYLTGPLQDDYLRLDTGAAGQSIGTVILQNIAVADALHPVVLFVSDSTAPDGSGNIPSSTQLTCTGTNPKPGTADYTFTGNGTGQYVYVRLQLPQDLPTSSMTIGGAVSWLPPAVPVPIIAAAGQLAGSVSQIAITGH